MEYLFAPYVVLENREIPIPEGLTNEQRIIWCKAACEGWKEFRNQDMTKWFEPIEPKNPDLEPK